MVAPALGDTVRVVAIYLAVYRIGRKSAGVGAEHLGRTPGRCEQHYLPLVGRERLDEGAGERCLARAGIAVEHKHRLRPCPYSAETRQGGHYGYLLVVGPVGQSHEHFRGKFLVVHHFCSRGL